MKKSEAQSRISAANFVGQSSTFVFASGIVVLMAQWVCLLAVLNPHVWMPWAHVARWIYATPLFVYLLAVLPGNKTGPESQLPKHPALVWLLLGSIANVAGIVALFNERFDVALVCGFAWNGLSAVQNWLLPNKKLDENAEKLPERYRREWKRFQRVNGVVYPLFFVILVATIALRSTPLCILLFLTIIVLQSVSFLRMKKEFVRFALERA